MRKKSNQPLKNPLAKLRLCLLYTFPAALFFSYRPVLTLAPTSDSMNFEFSLALLWLLLFALLSLGNFWRFLKQSWCVFRRSLSFSSAAPLLTLLFPLYLSLTFFWSLHPLRTILTAGVLWCLYISIIALLSRPSPLAPSKRALFERIFLYSSASVCLFCWLQCLLDVYGVSRESTLLCLGCTSLSFGFPHPSGFAIEPQFMGNLLLAPVLYSLYLFARPRMHIAPASSHLSLVFVFLSTLFLTFSRGAIYSFAVAYLFLFVINLVKLKNSRFWRTLPLVLFSFLFTLLAQGIFAAVSPTTDTFASGVEKSISQLSLGALELDLDGAPRSSAASEPATSDSLDAATTLPLDSSLSSSTFSGYVAESTDVRLGFNRLALELSVSSPAQLLFGSGLGSAGTLMFERGKTNTKFEIVQNEYLSLLLETGLIGLLLALFATGYLVLMLKKSLALPERCLLFAVVLSFALSLNFFSGLPNALHLYLFPVLLFLLLPKDKSVIDQKVNHHHHRRH